VNVADEIKERERERGVESSRTTDYKYCHHSSEFQYTEVDNSTDKHYDIFTQNYSPECVKIVAIIKRPGAFISCHRQANNHNNRARNI